MIIHFPEERRFVGRWPVGLCVVILLASYAAGNAADPVPGGRFFAGPDFASRSETERHWSRKAIEAAAPATIPALSVAKSVAIYSLDPTRLEDFRPGVTDRKHFHCYPILGRAEWRPGELDTLRRTLIEGLVPSERVLCFAPRHGMRIHTPTVTIDLVLSFECHEMRIFGSSTGNRTDECFFDEEVLNLLNAFLDARRIKRNIPPSEDEPR